MPLNDDYANDAAGAKTPNEFGITGQEATRKTRTGKMSERWAVTNSHAVSTTSTERLRQTMTAVEVEYSDIRPYLVASRKTDPQCHYFWLHYRKVRCTM
jgi:hypothetical protein